jgi:type I restriction-modification system DNA methylase subunit
MKTDKQMAAAAADFAKRWEGKGYERGQSQLFWADLLTTVYGVENLPEFLRYEEQVASMVDSTNFIDVHIPSTKVLIEQKSINIDLRKPIKRGDGYITPFLQAKLYIVNMPQSEHPKWVVTCNFKSFLVYDMNQPNSEPEEILLKDLGTEYYRLKFLVDEKSEHISKEMEVSMKAGVIVGQIYEALLKQYDDNSPEALRWLNILCVRIVFCLYAEDAGVFSRDQFHDYLVSYETKDLRNALIRLFEVLNTPIEKRSRYLMDDLKAFPYTNGGLFEEQIEIPQFTDELREVLLHNASLDFDWSKISPTIFGAVFESTLNPETRRSGGMHYTSIENIHKVIDPLFLNDLRKEYDAILEEKVEKQRVKQLNAFQEKLASLTFLDPACGSGNFLTETYLSLRRLENDVIRAKYHGQTMMGAFMNPIKVSIQQFYGIEINDFAVTVATTALWISEAQMLAETERIVQQDIDFLPLKPYHNIREGNALRMDWNVIELPNDIPTIHIKNAHLIYEEEANWKVGEPVIDLNEANLIVGDYQRGFKSNTKRYEIHYDYIIGNPPFVGARQMSEPQKQDMIHVFGAKWKNVGNMDYVCCWYMRAVNLMNHNRNTRAAFVSTNSICQGEQVASLWKPLFNLGIHIDFAHRTFRWDSEASFKAHVHCVIVGLSFVDTQRRYIFDNDQKKQVNHINAYLTEGPDVFIDKRNNPLCNVSSMNYGSFALDDGNFTINSTEYEDLLRRDPSIKQFLRPFIGAQEMLHAIPRWCVWLKDVPLNLYAKNTIIREKVERVQQWRASSSRKNTVMLADTPMLFAEIRQPNTKYLAVPTVCSEKRRYIPMMYLTPETIASNQVYIVPEATLYHLGVLMSNVHMAWMRIVCGRLKSDYRYSNSVVYNNFPWPSPTEEQRQRIEQTAQGIISARENNPGVCLADLYDPVYMPPNLHKAHQENDRAVMQAYGFSVKSTFTESQCVAELFKLYQELANKKS